MIQMNAVKPYEIDPAQAQSVSLGTVLSVFSSLQYSTNMDFHMPIQSEAALFLATRADFFSCRTTTQGATTTAATTIAVTTTTVTTTTRATTTVEGGTCIHNTDCDTSDWCDQKEARTAFFFGGLAFSIPSHIRMTKLEHLAVCEHVIPRYVVICVYMYIFIYIIWAAVWGL